MTSQYGPRSPSLNETKMRSCYDVACRVGKCNLIYLPNIKLRRSIMNRCSIKTSWRRLQHVQHVYSVTILRLPGRLEDVLQRPLEDVLKTSCNEDVLSWRRLEDMSWRRLEDLFWRRLEDIPWRCLEDISWRGLQDTMERNKILTVDLRNLNMYLTNLYFTNLYRTILRRIQNALIRTQ